MKSTEVQILPILASGTQLLNCGIYNVSGTKVIMTDVTATLNLKESHQQYFQKHFSSCFILFGSDLELLTKVSGIS